MLTGKIKITYQLTGSTQGIECLSKQYKLKSGVTRALHKLANEIEYKYSVYSNYDYIIEEANK